MEVTASQFDGSDSRYAHLLKPIKDLAKNWNIDLADSLSNYLEELGHITISFDGGMTKMNFAQAALLVQSSACVYSKKVEYLYSLVFKVMDLVSNKKKQAQKSSVDSEGNDNDANFNDDDDDEFLSLDDIQDGKNLYMKEDFEEGEKFQLLPEIPLCLIPLEENEKGDNPLLSKKGDVLGSRKDFKLNTCHIHSSGTLLLDLSHLKLLQQTLKQKKQTQDVEMDTPEEIRNLNEISVHGDDIQDDNLPVDHDINDSHNDMDQQEPVVPMQEPVEPESNVVCNRADRQAEAVIQKKSTHEKHIIDPLRPIDSMEKLKPDKPLVKSRNIVKLCPGIKGQSGKRKRKGTIATEKLEPIKDFITKRCLSRVLRFPKSARKDDCALEFEKLYWKEYKRRQSLSRDLLKKRKKADQQDRGEDEEEQAEEEEEVQIGEQFQGCDDIDVLVNEAPLVDDNFFNAIEGIATEDDDCIHERNENFSDEIDDALIVTSYEDLVRRHVEDYIASAGDFAQITDLSRRVSDWEDKIIPCLELEDTLGPFDINECGSCLLGGLSYKKSIRFSEIVQRRPVYEICRLFLASLMLANTENVKIKEIDSLEKGMDVFELELLSMRRHFEELQEYQAPSLG